MLTPQSPPSAVERGAVDACPGALRLHAAADGPLARVRLPGGLLTGAQLTAVRELAETWGDGHVELTSRANLQLRALTGAPPADLAARLWAAGLLPSQTHELVRNIAASPLSDRSARAVLADLDRGLCADPALAALPGRFLFALDDGTGDVAPAADVAAFGAGERVPILFAGVDAGLRVAPDAVVSALLAAAHAFLAERGAEASPAQASPARAGAEPTAWRVRELADGPARVAARTAAALGLRLGAPGPPPAPDPGETIGILTQPDGLLAVSALVPFGRLSGVPMKVLEKADRLVVTPWRGVVVADLPPPEADAWLRTLAEAGLEVAPGSRWSGVTACAGRPGCAKALADVRRDAATVVSDGPVPSAAGQLPVHWVGCERGCGSPSGPHVRVQATGSDYAVSAPGSTGRATAAEVGGLVAAARRS